VELLGAMAPVSALAGAPVSAAIELSVVVVAVADVSDAVGALWQAPMDRASAPIAPISKGLVAVITITSGGFSPAKNDPKAKAFPNT
jgi:hypothetical protein